MDSGIGVLRSKLDDFLKKYYKNKMLKGLILFLFWFLLSFLTVSILEYFGQFGTGLRTILFYLFILGNGFLLGNYVILPLTKLYRIGKIISYRQASQIIGTFFPEVSDKLLTTLELEEMMKEQPSYAPFLLASISQRTEQLKPVPFNQSIRFGENKKYLQYVIIPLAIIIATAAYSPDIFSESTKRILSHNQVFKPKAPFNFIIENVKLIVNQSEDFQLKMKAEGTILPNEVYIIRDGQKYKCTKDSKDHFIFTFAKPMSSIVFAIEAEDFDFGPYTLEVIPKPVLGSFNVRLNYPSYLKKENEQLSNQGDLVIPEGTKVEWIFNGRNVTDLTLAQAGKLYQTKKEENQFNLSLEPTQSGPYQVYLKNDYHPQPDSIAFNITLIPDEYPQVQVNETIDSTNGDIRYFQGSISDDHGFHQLLLKAMISSKSSSKTINKTQVIPIQKSSTNQVFYHYINLNEWKLKEGESLSWYFEVLDNDGYHGPKASRSSSFSYKQPTIAEKEKVEEKRSEGIQANVKQAMDDVKKLQKDVDQLRKKLQDKEAVSWDDMKKIEQLEKKQEEVRKALEQAKKLNQESIKEQEKEQERDPESDQILEKQKELQSMVDKLLTDDLKKLMEELQRMTEEKFNKDELQKQLNDMKVDNKDIQKELDRMLSFFKELEFEKKFDQATDKLDALAKEQEKLSNEKADTKEEQQKQKDKQDELNKSFNDLQKDLKDLQKKNEELDRPNDLGDLDKSSQDIEKEMKESSDEMQKGNSKSSKSKQKNAASKMNSLSQQMKQKKQESEQEEAEEDMKSLRQLLANLVRLSFGQEKLIDRLKENSTYSQAYVRIGQDQYKLKDDARLIEDSLLALSKRQMKLESFINKEVTSLNDHLIKSIEALGGRNTPIAKVEQQYVMTSVNNLAVMLTDALKNMQEQQQQQKQGNGQCKKPGKKKNGSGSLSKLQKELNDQMQKMKDGNKPQQDGMPKPGQRNSGRMQSKEFAQMVAKQQAIRRELQKMGQEIGNQGKDGKQAKEKLDKLAQEMEKTERDLLNKRLDIETMKRQQDIVTRLLESEKAEREREQDNKRESNTGDQKIVSKPEGYDEFIKKRARDLEFYKTIPPNFNTYYKKKVSSYFDLLNKAN